MTEDSSTPFAVHSCARTHMQARHSAPGIRKGNCHLRVLSAGHGWYYDGEHRHELREGHCLILDGNAQGYVSCDPDDPYDFYFIGYNGSLARELTNNIITQHGILFNPELQHSIIQLCKRIYNLPFSAGKSFNLADALLSEILLHLLNDSAVDKPNVTFNKIIHHLENNLNAPIHREQVAKRFQVHPLTIDRLCKQQNGQTLRQIHESMRIDFARSLLSDHRNNVSTVAEQLGYDDPFHFSRVFKKIIGISPKQFQVKTQ